MNSDKRKCLIAFGANLGDKEQTAAQAQVAINKQIGSIIKSSSLFETEPLLLPDQEPGSQPSYLNAVWLVETSLQPQACLEALLQIENEFGRVRTERWGSRTIDLDLISSGAEIISSEKLTLPHPEMHKRRFVLEPLCQIWPEWQHPLLNKSAQKLLSELV